ncbi:MAG: hypothetical protein GY705_02785 [Bacteroidetes bacterium]|nr:hypothetical protein [Bacteroidota bacterium]
MKKILYLFGLLFIVSLFFTSCTKEEDENAFWGLETKGAVALTSNVVNGFFDLANPDASSIAFDIDTKGEAVSSLAITKNVNGSGEQDLSTLNSFPATVAVTFNEALSGTGINVSDLEPGDKAVFSFYVTTPTGTYPGGTLSIDMSCVSDLAGTYTSEATGTSTDGCCPGSHTVTADVTLTDLGAGKYDISDWSGGLYPEWYTVYGITPDDVHGEILDVCNVITLLTSSEPFGESLTGSEGAAVDPTTGVISYHWDNGWGDEGTVKLTPK